MPCNLGIFGIENGLAELSLDDKKEEILQAHNESDTAKDIYDLCLVGCFLTASAIHHKEHNGESLALCERGPYHRSRGVKIYVSIFSQDGSQLSAKWGSMDF
ncbi:hypothetical protein J1N35_001553 [Gossypium stocksii]|uniref:Uncharacterized protein n=1 Tax=Gossypium stocksii TaxID=47602 RepID=A0A9D3WK42_9ROSI|nr:hypothetical protein J1N35_001553 [Gossypium stocksii]